MDPIALVAFLIMMSIGYLFGRVAEKKHFRQLDEREQKLAAMLVTDLKRFPGGADASVKGALVTGEVVIATDYFKSFLASLRNIFGGELKSYQTLLTRAKREAILRMKEEAARMGFNAVCNVRVGSSDIGGMAGKRGVAMVETFAWGTAYRTPGHEPVQH